MIFRTTNYSSEILDALEDVVQPYEQRVRMFSFLISNGLQL